MPILDLSTKKSFIIYQQGVIESHMSGYRGVKLLNKTESKAKLAEKESKKTTTSPSSEDAL